MTFHGTLAALESLTLPRDAWTHRAHLRAALACLEEAPVPAATARFGAAVRAFNQHHGLDGYHETLTAAYMTLLARDRRALPADAPEPLVEACAIAGCGAKGVILDYYSRDLVLGPAAREAFVAPDLRPFDDRGLAVVVRPEGPADDDAAEAAMVVLQEDLRAVDDVLIPGWEMARGYLGYVRESCAKKEGVVFLATLGAAVAGFGSVWIERDVEPLESTVNAHAYVSDLVVFPAARRRGVAQALIAAAVDHGRAHGMTQLHLNVLAQNHGAVRFYEADGFYAKRMAMVKSIS